MTSMPSRKTPNPPLATGGHDTHVQDQGAPRDSVNRLVEQSCRKAERDRTMKSKLWTTKLGFLLLACHVCPNEQSLGSQVASVATHTSVLTLWRSQIKQTHTALPT